MQESAEEIEEMTKAAAAKPTLLTGVKNLLPNPRKCSVAASGSNRQLERKRALEKLSELSIGLLRKTKLQVRVVIEVFHCKNARYMLTEATDVLQPTLVIVGSRGLSVVKGALAGSFSRYLIMKSSVPVMTARMRVSSRKIQQHRPKVRLGNYLMPSKRLMNARLDHDVDDDTDSQKESEEDEETDDRVAATSESEVFE